MRLTEKQQKRVAESLNLAQHATRFVTKHFRQRYGSDHWIAEGQYALCLASVKWDTYAVKPCNWTLFAVRNIRWAILRAVEKLLPFDSRNTQEEYDQLDRPETQSMESFWFDDEFTAARTRFPSYTQTILHMRLVNGMTEYDIARTLGDKKHRVRRTLARALESLKPFAEEFCR